ncbi:hypothetical protein [Nocardia sp. NPDC127526]|uniref:hypothetical protein n=1 Tax=Nocardia sp. NPDC127526 TaxID=3345393 RepID=UPI00363F0C1A
MAEDRGRREDPPCSDPLTVAEFISLRAEIVKLIELQTQLISLSVIAVGAVLGVAVQTKSASLAFVFPLLAIILGISWLNHAHAIHRYAAYLGRHLETRFGEEVLGWEKFVRQHPIRFGVIGYWGLRAVFMASSLAASVIGWTLVENRPAPLVLGAVSTLITVGTFVLFLVWQEDSPENRR